MIVKVLVENTAINPIFEFEHGLSLYIETLKHKILFDVGQTDMYLKNAEKLNIDLKQVDIAVISHAHYDHTGGLKSFLELNKTAKIYINENANGDYFNASDKYIGIDKMVLNNPRLIFTKDELIIDEDLYLFTGNKFERNFDSHSKNLTTVIDGLKQEDNYDHEQYLIINEKEKNTLISGCSHKGILNILDFAKPHNIKNVIGGFHLKDLDENQSLVSLLLEFSNLLNRNDLQYYTCHCTGKNKFEIMKKAMGNRLSYISAGQIINI